MMLVSKLSALLVGAGVVASAATGCGVAVDDGSSEDRAPGEVEQSLTCVGAACDGLRPSDTQCKLDMIDTGVGAQVFDAAGNAIGGIGLFRSPSCQTVWATSAFYTSGGPRSYRICAVRVKATLNDPSCFDYTGSLGNDSPMKFANSGKTVFGRVTVGAVTTRTPEYTVP